MPCEYSKVSDLFFDAHVKYIEKYDKLHPKIFGSLTVYGYNQKQEAILYKLFMGMLHPIPEKRMNIGMIKKLFAELNLQY
jgi:hypothetical protein